jgi:hypothetical protein
MLCAFARLVERGRRAADLAGSADKTRAFLIRLLTISFCEMKEVAGIPIMRPIMELQGKGWP